MTGVTAQDLPASVLMADRHLGIAAINPHPHPDLVFIGGGLSRVGDRLLQPLRHWLTELRLITPPRIYVSALSDESVALGAVRTALDHLDQEIFDAGLQLWPPSAVHTVGVVRQGLPMPGWTRFLPVHRCTPASPRGGWCAILLAGQVGDAQGLHPLRVGAPGAHGAHVRHVQPLGPVPAAGGRPARR